MDISEHNYDVFCFVYQICAVNYVCNAFSDYRWR